MSETVTSVGAAIAAALDRAEVLRSLSDRPVRVWIMTVFGDDRSGLTINARIPSRTPAEHQAQEGLGTRCIPWTELDARAGELVDLVDEVVGEVTLAVMEAPPSSRPSRSEQDFEMEAFERLVDELAGAIATSAMAVLERSRDDKISPVLGSEATMTAALKLAALAAYTCNIGLNEAQDELRRAVGDVMNKARTLLETSPHGKLNS